MPYRRLYRPWLIGISLATLVFVAYHQGSLDSLELRTLDGRFRLRGPFSPQLPIVIVSIDQDSFDELDLSWPWPRTLHAELIRKLTAQQAALIAMDILFTEPRADSAEDQALADAIQTAGNVVLAAEYTEVPGDFGPKISMNLPLPLLRERALGYGPVNLIADHDGVVRSTLLGLPFQERVYPAFAYQVYQQIPDPNKPPTHERVSPQPQVYYINFRGPARSYPIVPYYRVLRDELEPTFFKDKIVFVGALAASLHDLYPTPFSAYQPTAGVEVQANFVETLTANDPIRPISASRHALLFTLLAVMTIGGTAWLKPLQAFGLILGLGGFYAILTLVLFTRDQWWLPFAPPLLAMALCYGGMTLDGYIREQRERLRLRTIFRRYVPTGVVDEILDHPEDLGLHGRRRHITILFSDIRGFTSISEQIDPEQVVAFLSAYLSQATQIIFKHGGTVDKFIGDAIMALFGTPRSHGDDAFRAVRAGQELAALVESFGPQWTPILGRPFKVGIGINSGDAVVGNIGSDLRSDFTAIGDAVNLASRLEGLTKEFGIPLILSEYTAAELKGQVALKPLGSVRVTGRQAALLIFTTAEGSKASQQVKTAM